MSRYCIMKCRLERPFRCRSQRLIHYNHVLDSNSETLRVGYIPTRQAVKIGSGAPASLRNSKSKKNWCTMYPPFLDQNENRINFGITKKRYLSVMRLLIDKSTYLRFKGSLKPIRLARSNNNPSALRISSSH